MPRILCMSCKFAALILGFLAVLFSASRARRDDFPSIKAKDPEIYKEVASLAARHPDIKKLVTRDDAAGVGIHSDTKDAALWRAAQECMWSTPILAERFPALCEECRVVGIADAGSKAPKLIYPDSLGFLEIVFDGRKGNESRDSFGYGDEYNDYD